MMSRLYWDKQEYIKGVAKVLEAREDFDTLEYVRSDKTGEEFVILKDIIGHVWVFNVTGFNEAQMFHTLAILECGYKPSNLIESSKKQMEVARLRK